MIIYILKSAFRGTFITSGVSNIIQVWR